GGYGAGDAHGSDMIAEIGGVRYAPAETAQLRHRESTGLITANGTFTVTGQFGSASIAVVIGQTLGQVAAAINAQQGTTGVVARVDDVDLVVESRQAGASSEVAIEVTAGSFTAVSGYQAAAAAELTYTGAVGKLVGNVSFDLTGTGTASYAFNDGDSLASIRDAINLDTGTTGVVASVDGDQLILRSETTGESASIAVTNVTGSFEVDGGNGDGTANGANATASATGQSATTPHALLRGNQLTVNRNGTHFQIEMAPAFSGQFHTMTVSSGAPNFALATDLHYLSVLSIFSLESAQLGGMSGGLDEILSGGSAGGLGQNTSRALRIVSEALGQVGVAAGVVDGFYNASISASSALLADLQADLEDGVAQTDGYNEDEENLLLEKNEALASNALAGLAIMYRQRQALIDIIQHVAGLGS
ncbi:MAG: flagellin hook IN motif-containing protein, partial [Thermoguttaceae bacterium]